VKQARLLLSLNKKGKDSEVVKGHGLKNITNTLHQSAVPQAVENTSAEKLRFAQPACEQELKQAAKGVVPDSTRSSTNWDYLSWAENRNKRIPDDPVSLDLFKSDDADLVCKTLCKFVLETRNCNGEQYPPCTIRLLLSGLNRFFKENKAPFSVMSKEDPQFRDLSLTLDTVTK